MRPSIFGVVQITIGSTNPPFLLCTHSYCVKCNAHGRPSHRSPVASIKSINNGVIGPYSHNYCRRKGKDIIDILGCGNSSILHIDAVGWIICEVDVATIPTNPGVPRACTGDSCGVVCGNKAGNNLSPGLYTIQDVSRRRVVDTKVGSCVRDYNQIFTYALSIIRVLPSRQSCNGRISTCSHTIGSKDNLRPQAGRSPLWSGDCKDLFTARADFTASTTVRPVTYRNRNDLVRNLRR